MFVYQKREQNAERLTENGRHYSAQVNIESKLKSIKLFRSSHITEHGNKS